MAGRKLDVPAAQRVADDEVVAEAGRKVADAPPPEKEEEPIAPEIDSRKNDRSSPPASLRERDSKTPKMSTLDK